MRDTDNRQDRYVFPSCAPLSCLPPLATRFLPLATQKKNRGSVGEPRFVDFVLSRERYSDSSDKTYSGNGTLLLLPRGVIKACMTR